MSPGLETQDSARGKQAPLTTASRKGATNVAVARAVSVARSQVQGFVSSGFRAVAEAATGPATGTGGAIQIGFSRRRRHRNCAPQSWAELATRLPGSVRLLLLFQKTEIKNPAKKYERNPLTFR